MPYIRPFLTVVQSDSSEASTAFDKSADPNLISTLESMLAKAHSGEITGLMYVVRMGDVDHGLCVTGTYKAKPLDCMAALDTFFSLLSRNSKTV